MPYKGGVQLLPETRRERARKVVAGNRMVYWGIALGVIVLVLNVIMSAYATSLREQIAAADGQLRLQEEQRDEDAEDRLQATQRQSRLMNQLLRNHVYWSQGFAFLERLMQSNVTLEALAMSAENGTLEFSARGSSYAAVARQIAAFTAAEGVQDVELGGVSASTDGGVEFSGVITISASEVITRTPAPAAAP